jgi:hypothetical protein
MEGRGRVVDLGLYREHVAAAAGLRAEAGKDGADRTLVGQLLRHAAVMEARAGAIARGQRQPVGRQPAGARHAQRFTG